MSYTSGSQYMGRDTQLGRGEHHDSWRIFYQDHFTFYFTRILID
jgi:hypothetical protein